MKRGARILTDRDSHVAQSTLLAGLVDPSQVGEFGVDGGSNDLAVDFAELGGLFREGDNLGGAAVILHWKW
jgi:hypothetical protein